MYLVLGLSLAAIIVGIVAYLLPDDHLGTTVTALSIVLSTILFAMPSVIAIRRKHSSLLPILLLNLLCGLSILGWIVALFWSVSEIKQQPTND